MIPAGRLLHESLSKEIIPEGEKPRDVPTTPQHEAEPITPQPEAEPITPQHEAKPITPQHEAEPITPQHEAEPTIPQRCFIAGTTILTSLGTNAIESLTPGEEVISFNTFFQKTSCQKILRKFTGKVTTVLDMLIVRVTLSSKTESEGTSYETIPIQLNHYTEKNAITITCTPEHPFWIVDKGWQKAVDIKPMSRLLSKKNHTVYVNSICTRDCSSSTVYNLEVDGDHTYFISDFEVLVHNKAMKAGMSREERLNELAKDPAHGYKETDGSRREAERALELEDDDDL